MLSNQEKAFAYDDLLWRLKNLDELGHNLLTAEKTPSMHPKDWDQGFVEAKHMIGVWITRITEKIAKEAESYIDSYAGMKAVATGKKASSL